MKSLFGPLFILIGEEVLLLLILTKQKEVGYHVGILLLRHCFPFIPYRILVAIVFVAAENERV